MRQAYSLAHGLVGETAFTAPDYALWPLSRKRQLSPTTLFWAAG